MQKSEPIIKEKPRKKPKRDLGLTAFLVIVLALLIGIPAYLFLPKKQAYKLDNYTYTTVREEMFRELIYTTSTIKPQQSQDFTSRYPGMIKDIFVESGQDVKAGDILLVIYSLELEKSLREQQELLAKAYVELEKAQIDSELEVQKHQWSIRDQEKTLQNAKENLEEKQLMYSLGTVSKRELEEAKALVVSSEEDLYMRQKNLEKIQITTSLAIDTSKREIKTIEEKIIDIEKSISENSLTAPFNGKVLEVLVKPNTEVNANTTLLRLASTDNPYAEGKISPQDADRVKEGMPATIKIAGRSHSAKVSKLSYGVSADKGTPYILATFDFDTDIGFVLPGTEASVEIELEKRDNVICLPRGPYISSGQNMFVYKIEGNKAIRTDVTYGSYDGNLVEIKRGLKPGDYIVTSSYEAFKDKVEIVLNPEGGRLQ